ncbi:hypothetical protein HUJ04_013103 [Dendroctonus ponderosae]|uniref:DNA-directed RNA polymerase III subunit n=1 Tax=Dendroctonus ponderosae TaxID=77166 RepID=A0AAR5QFM6_DENPD|nr:hypothetical protein HUJ04_013103 [Dendroctonus ponderosae]
MNRGRGGGRGGLSRSFNKEQLSALGVANNEMPILVTQPPSVYPLMERRPVPLTQSEDTEYLLLLRQDFIDRMQLSAAYLKMPSKEKTQPNQEIDRLVAQLPSAKDKYDWSLLPAELRPKLLARKVKEVPVATKSINVQEKLKTLENLEETKDKNPVKGQVKDGEEDLLEEASEDEQMDDGTDYADNYFDTGEDYEEEDDNMDEGPIY